MRNKFLLFGLLVGMIVLVGAVTWVGGISTFQGDEGNYYQYNLSNNLSNVESNLSIGIDTINNNITWDNGTLVFSYTSLDSIPWFSFNSSDFVVGINVTRNNESGKFNIPFQASDNATVGTSEIIEFIINATNDAPIFTNIESVYDMSQDNNFLDYLNASDEEEHYPLDFNITFISNNCTHSVDSGMNDNENCSLFDFGFSLDNSSDVSALMNFTPNSTHVGVYWANVSVVDYNSGCPHSYCDNASYEQNLTTYSSELVRFNVNSILTVDASNCTGATVLEGNTFNCTINITTQGNMDSLDFSSLATLRSGRAYTGDASWFYADATDNASSFFYSLPISITPTKENVGNWTINFSVNDGSSPEVVQIEIFVNYTESNVSLDSISNLTLYEAGNFSVNAYDNDLLIQDYDDVKEEILTFASNTTWVNAGTASTGSGNNYSTSLISIDYGSALISPGEGNHSVLINVTDVFGNVDSRIFVVEILNATIPIWNVSDPVVLNLTEDVLFTYNVSVNVSDPDETVTFYYENISAEFCSLNASSFNSSGMISFTPTDCSVGFHNVSIIATNGKLNSSSVSFLFNISNVADAPSIDDLYRDNDPSTITNGSATSVEEGNATTFILPISDDDFLIPEGVYNESLIIDLTFTNSTGSVINNLFNFTFMDSGNPLEQNVRYNATFNPSVAEVGDYTVFLNITDSFGLSTNRTFYLNVTGVLQAPVLQQVDNASLTIYDYLNFTLNATDNEDDFNGKALNYSIAALDVGSPSLSVGLVNGSIEFDMASNVSAAGEWRYNVSVNDSDGEIDWQVFYLFVYGNATLVSADAIFNLTENITSILNFTVNHSVGDNLTYEFWIDSVSCTFQNSSNCTYGNFSLRELTSSFGNGSVFGWNFTPNFLDETYGNLKNLTVSVYPNSTELNSSQRASVAANFSFSFNVSHANAPVVFSSSMRDASTTNVQSITYNLDEFFSDADVDDAYYAQNLTLSFLSSDSTSNIDANGVRIPGNVTQENWGLAFNTGFRSSGFSEIVNVTVYDLNSSNNNITLTSAVSNNFELAFTVPSSAPSSGGGGGGSSSTKLKFYSLRIIVPEDVIMDDDFIEVPFGLENHAEFDLYGINLTSDILYNNAFSSDVRIELGDTYIDVLRIGERREFTMKIFADMDRSGKYKATIFADIASPQFNDWADFFIDLRKTNESEAEELLIFTEKIVSDNPECLELTEVFRRAKEALDRGDIENAVKLAQEVSEACEDAISANEQIKYRVDGFVEKNFYYISFMTLVIFFAGFVMYVYKRVRFNKSVEDPYVR